MKTQKVIRRFSVLVWAFALIPFFFVLSASASTVTVSGRQLLVNCSPFLVRGMNYGPVPIGNGNGEWASNLTVTQADFAQMQTMGVNAIRVYFNYAGLFNSDGTVNVGMKANYDRLLALAASDGIFVIPNFWVPYNVDYTNGTNLSQIETQFAAVINLFKNSSTYPSILMWVLGDENNSAANLTPMTDTQMFEFYQNVLAYEKTNADNSHPYSVALVQNGDLNNSAYTNLVTSIDIWSCNVYQSTSSSFNSSFITAYGLTKPLLVTEFGNDAYNNNGGSEDDTDQANFFNDVWPNSFGANLSALNSGHKLLGGCVFEWNDEWWKCGTNSTHDTCGESLGVLPDSYGNEEWFGLSTALSVGSSGPRTYRSAFNTLKSYWTSSPYNTIVPAICGTSPTFTPTASPTSVPTYGASCVTVIDDFNNGSGGTNTFNGTWAMSWGSGSGGALNYQAPGYTGYGMQFSWSIAAGQYGECFTGLSPTANPTGTGTGTVDLSNYGAVRFWINASVPSAYWFKLASTQTYGGAGYAWWQATFNATSTGWTQVVISLDGTTFTNPSGNSGTFAQNLAAATQLVIQPQATGAAFAWIDDMDLVKNTCLSTPTPTKTNTPVPPTNSFTPTKTNTPTSTNTPVPPTNSFTPTPTNTNSPVPPTATFTHSFTPTFTNSPVPPTNTYTYTPIPPTNTFTSTKTNTPVPPTATYTYTPVPPTNTFTFTKTNTPVPPTNTYTNTPIPPTNTFTSTFTFTNTSTKSFTPTSTNTPVPPTSTFTPLTSATPTFTVSIVPTFTQTSAATATSTASMTPVASLTATPSFTSAFTFTNTSTKSFTPTSTNTPIPPTNSFTPTFSYTNTSTPTFTNTSTSTNTGTSTNTPLVSFTPTSTSTSTNSPVNSFTPTAISTFTSTLTGTNSFTPSFTPTFTNSPVPPTSSFTPTVTATLTFTVSPVLTFTPTFSSTNTATSTFTGTPTHTSVPPTMTPTKTSTPTFTHSPVAATPTFTSTSTVTTTRTPLTSGVPVVYPNPVSGPGPVELRLPFTAASDVRIKVYTTAFRMVNDLSANDVQPGEGVPVPLNNEWGVPLADGVYYLVGQAGGKHWVAKLLIIR